MALLNLRQPLQRIHHDLPTPLFALRSHDVWGNEWWGSKLALPCLFAARRCARAERSNRTAPDRSKNYEDECSQQSKDARNVVCVKAQKL